MFSGQFKRGFNSNSNMVLGVITFVKLLMYANCVYFVIQSDPPNPPLLGLPNW